jgi:hypothetical protein
MPALERLGAAVRVARARPTFGFGGIGGIWKGLAILSLPVSTAHATVPIT